MPKSNNPAGRLYSLLQQSAAIPPNTTYAEGWRRLLQIENRDVSILLARLAPILRLPNEAKTAIVALGDAVDQDLLLRWVPDIERAFSVINLGATWEELTRHINSMSLYGLEVASDQLSRLAPEPVPSDEELADLLKQVLDLRARVESENLDAVLKDFLLEHLRAAEFALRDFRFRGMPALRTVVEQFLGNAWLSPKVAARWKDEGVTRQFSALMRRLVTVVTVAAGVVQIADGIERRLLPKPSVGIEIILQLDQDGKPSHHQVTPPHKEVTPSPEVVDGVIEV